MGEWISALLDLLPLVAFEVGLLLYAIRTTRPLGSFIALQSIFATVLAVTVLVSGDTAVLWAPASVIGIATLIGVVIARRRVEVTRASAPEPVDPDVLASLETRLAALVESLQSGREPSMPIHAERVVVVDVPPAALFEYVTDPPSWSEYAVYPVTNVSAPEPLHLGSTYRVDLIYGSTEVPTLSLVTDLAPPTSWTSICLGPRVVSEGRMRIDESPSGGSIVRMFVRVGYVSPALRAWSLVMWPILMLVSGRGLTSAARLLKSAAEAHYQRTLEGSPPTT